MYMIREDVIDATLRNLEDMIANFRDGRKVTVNQAATIKAVITVLKECIQGKYDAKLET